MPRTDDDEEVLDDVELDDDVELLVEDEEDVDDCIWGGGAEGH
jgi:hypothetical protein